MTINELPKVMIISLTCTIIIEVVVAFILKYRGKDILNIVLVNILTNPLLNSIIVAINYYYGLKARNIVLIILEILVVIVEGFMYQQYLTKKKLNGYILSLILNIASYEIGLLVNKVFY